MELKNEYIYIYIVRQKCRKLKSKENYTDRTFICKYETQS